MDLYRINKRPLIIGLVFGVIVTAGIAIFADAGNVLTALKSIDRRLLPLLLVLAPLNYLLRFVKWNYYLKITGIRPDPRVNRYIFLSGLSMTLTPGKVGELLKCYLLKEHMGVPISRSAPIVMAERVTDGLALVILACLGMLAYPFGTVIVITAAVLLTVLILFFHYRALFNALTEKLAGVLFLKKALHFGHSFYSGAGDLLTLRRLPIPLAIGIISWSFEGLVVFLAVRALGGEFPLLGAFFVIGLSSLAGALSFVPGGLGPAEGSIMAILILAGLDRDLAAATTLITRFSTLWLGVGLGLVGLVKVQGLLGKQAARSG